MSPEPASIRALVVDDEPAAREGLHLLAAGEPDLEVVGDCADAAQAVARILAGGVDLVFLDVAMPGGSGFEVIERVGTTQMPEVIFVTAYDHFAVAAFEHAALDFLTKPVERGRFAAAVERFRQRRSAARAGELVRQLERMLAALPRTAAGLRLAARTGSRLVMIEESEIEWFEADGDFTRVHVRRAGQAVTSHLLTEPLASLESRLAPGRFVRIHRALLVAVAKIREVRFAGNGTARVLLAGGQELPVSRRCRPALEAALTPPLTGRS